MLSPEDQFIVEESKEHHDKSAETQKKNTDKKCEVLANQLVDKYGRDASKFLNRTADRLKSLLGDRKSEFEWLPSPGTVDRPWQTLSAKSIYLTMRQPLPCHQPANHCLPSSSR